MLKISVVLHEEPALELEPGNDLFRCILAFFYPGLSRNKKI